MKTHLLTLAAIAAFTTLAAADSPDAILKDYRTRATQATQRLNETLEKQAAPIITDLLRKNDTPGAESVASQVKAKLAGEPVIAPHVAAAALFAQFDGARATALQPIQRACLARINSLLNVAGGPKVAEMESIAKAKEEIETGSTPPSIATLFLGKSYYTKAGSEYHFDKNGAGWRLQTMDHPTKVPFTWTQKNNGIVEVQQRKTPSSSPSLTFFKFVDRKTAYQGDTEANINSLLLVQK